MGNPLKGEVLLAAGGERYVLSYSVEALYRLEKATGRRMGELKGVLADPDGFSMEMLRTMFWAGLIDNRPDTELDQVGPILSQIPPIDVVTAVTRAFVGAFSDPDEVANDAAKEAPKPSPRKPGQVKSGTGSAS